MVTCEIDPFLKEFTRPFFDASPHGSKIEVRIGSAIDTMRSFDINVRTPALHPPRTRPAPTRARPADSSARLTLTLTLTARTPSTWLGLALLSRTLGRTPPSAVPLGCSRTHPHTHARVSRGLQSPQA